MPINASPHYLKAEDEYLQAQTTEQKIKCLKKMLALAPKHKGAENLLKQLKTRLAKLKYTKEKEIQKGKHKGIGIKKSDMQAVIIGKTNSGKSALLKLLTNAQPKVSQIQFTTSQPEIGMMNYASTQIQIIENPPIDSPNYDKGLTNSADTLILIVTSLEEIKEIQKQIPKDKNQKHIIAFNKIDILDQEQKRKLKATLDSKKHNYQLISTKTSGGIEELKGLIFQSFNKIRIYTKDPNKKQHDTEKPVILEPGETVQDVAEKILHGFSKKVISTKLWGPSSKFQGQQVGLTHKLKDMDIVEFKTK
jgi:ribosome-interacting GTPase 1